jgi:putative transposase
VSVIGAVSVSPTTRRLGFYFATDPQNYFTPAKVVAFLRDLLRHLRGKVIVVWDGGTNHRGPVVRAFLRRNRRLRLERLPAYCPDLNPVEAVWGWLKYGQLANYVPPDVDALDWEILDRLVELKHTPGLLRALWDASDLPVPRLEHTQGGLPADQ